MCKPRLTPLAYAYALSHSLWQLEEATACAAEAFKTWRNVPVQQRMRVMLKYQVRFSGLQFQPRVAS